jgi:hypothetical protein
MLADFFTKPLQGSLFTKFRRVIMGHDHIDSLKQDNACSPSKERVGKTILDKFWNGSRASNASTQDGVSTGMRISDDSTKELKRDLRTSLKQHGEILKDVTYADAVKYHGTNTVNCRVSSAKVRSESFSLSKINPIVTTV